MAAKTERGYLNLKKKVLENGTNIVDINVPDYLKRRILTGIEWFDQSAGGEEEAGLTPSTVTLLTAVPGGGKSTLCLTLADSLTKRGVTCLYNAGEESVYQVRKTVDRLQLNSGFIIGQDHKLADVLNHAREMKKAHPRKDMVLVIDSLATLDDGFYPNGATNSQTPVRVMEGLVDFAKESKAAIIVIGHVTKRGDFSGKQKIAHDCDARCGIKYDLDKKSSTFGKRIFQYYKNRFGPCNPLGVVLDMTKEGLVLQGKQEDYDLSGEEE